MTSASPLQRAGNVANNEQKPKHPNIWPGMPMRESQMFESLVGLFPIWLALIGLSVALLLPLGHACRNAALGRAGPAPPTAEP
jgi:hypothetical protein